MSIEEKQAILDKAAEAQSAFWSALSILENALGIEVDGNQELLGLTPEELEAQSAFWSALSILENALGIEVDGNQELLGLTPEELCELLESDS